MNQIEKKLEELKCSIEKRNNLEVKYWKKLFLAKKPIPSPFINKSDEIIAFHNCFFAMQDAGLRKIWCNQE